MSISPTDDMKKLYLVTNSDLSFSKANVQDNLNDFRIYQGGSPTVTKDIDSIYYKYYMTARAFAGSNPIPFDMPFSIQKEGTFSFNDGKLYFNDSDGDTQNRSFSQLSITAIGKYSVKQGLFFRQQSVSNGSLGESYIQSTSLANPSVTLNTYVNMGAIVKTRGEATSVSVTANPNSSGNITIGGLNATAYKVRADNILTTENITVVPSASGNSITVNIPNKARLGDSYYIINYGYKIIGDENTFKTTYGDSGVQIENNCTIVNTNVSDNYDYTIVNFPDLF